MDDNCSNESSEDEEAKVLFMGIENKITEEDVQGVIYLEAKLISALEELRKYERMYKKSKTQLTELEEENNDAERTFTD